MPLGLQILFGFLFGCFGMMAAMIAIGIAKGFQSHIADYPALFFGAVAFGFAVGASSTLFM